MNDFNKELMVYKSQKLQKMQNNNNKYLNSANQLDITYFDTIKGLAQETVDVVNFKIEEVK